MTEDADPSILVLGIGNTLMADDGVGPSVIAALEKNYCFPEWVSLIDGGTRAGLLLPYVMACTHFLVVDAVDLAEPAGTVYTLGDQELAKLGHKGISGAHDTTVLHLLNQADLVDARPKHVAAVGVQPQEIGLLPVKLSRPVGESLPEACQAVVGVLERWGAKIDAAKDSSRYVINAAIPYD